MKNSRSDLIYSIPAKEVLGLATNVRNFGWPYGRKAPTASQADYHACAIQMRLQVDSNETFADLENMCSKEEWGKYHFFWGQPGGHLIFYQRHFMFNSKFYIEVSNLENQLTTIRVNRDYFRFVTFRFMNLHSVAYLLTDLATLLLLRKCLTPIYCSAFHIDERTILVFAPSNTGKTLTTMKACLEHNADFIAEDIAITDGQQVFAVPWTRSFRYYDDAGIKWIERFIHRAIHMLPLLGLLPITQDKSITDFLSEERICHRSTVTHLVILERGGSAFYSESRKLALHKILNLNRAQFNYHHSLLNNAYEFFNPELDISSASEIEQTILRRLVESVQECLVIRTNEATDYADLVLQAIAQ